MNQFLSRFSELDNADQRAFLYSDLSSQKTDNPEGYQEAFKFWSRLLLQACEQGLLSATNSAKQQPNRSDDSDKGSATNDTYSALCIDRRGLAARLAFHGDTPMGVDEVVDDMVRQGDLVPMSEFLVGSGA
ncbi:Charged multivesicular body protein 7, partial [Coemansia brasiliensis]